MIWQAGVAGLVALGWSGAAGDARMSIRARIIDALFWVIGTLLLRKAFPKLTENAVSGYIDDKIGEALGWSAPDVSTVLSWVWPAVVVALVLWGYMKFIAG